MVTKDTALKKVRSEFPDHYVTGVNSWGNYFVFHLLWKNPDRIQSVNQPFSVLVKRDTGEIGTGDILMIAKEVGKEKECSNSLQRTYEEIDKTPGIEDDPLFAGLFKR